MEGLLLSYKNYIEVQNIAVRYDPDNKWSVTETENGARSNVNVSNPPFFPIIPLKNVVIDNLHLFLQVADVLINVLITELKQQDAIEKRNPSVAFLARNKHLYNFQQ